MIIVNQIIKIQNLLKLKVNHLWIKWDPPTNALFLIHVNDKNSADKISHSIQ